MQRENVFSLECVHTPAGLQDDSEVIQRDGATELKLQTEGDLRRSEKNDTSITPSLHVHANSFIISSSLHFHRIKH